MDWNTFLFAIRWIIISLFYFVLIVLLVGVYREASSGLNQKNRNEGIVYGRLRVLQSGSDPNLAVGSILNLKSTTRLGADTDNDIVLADRFVSSNHVRFRWDGVAWWLEDLNSRNGTLVNHQPWPPGQPGTVPIGSVITIGDVVVELLE